MNLYGFVLNGPVHLVDATGLSIGPHWPPGQNEPPEEASAVMPCCICKTVKVTSRGQLYAQKNNPIVHLMVPVDIKIQVEGDPSECTCKHVDKGNITDQWTSGAGDTGGGPTTFDDKEHDVTCADYTDGPGAQYTFTPWSGSIKGKITYDLTITVTCSGTLGDKSDSDTVRGTYRFNTRIP